MGGMEQLIAPITDKIKSMSQGDFLSTAVGSAPEEVIKGDDPLKSAIGSAPASMINDGGNTQRPAPPTINSPQSSSYNLNDIFSAANSANKVYGAFDPDASKETGQYLNGAQGANDFYDQYLKRKRGVQ